MVSLKILFGTSFVFRLYEKENSFKKDFGDIDLDPRD